MPGLSKRELRQKTICGVLLALIGIALLVLGVLLFTKALNKNSNVVQDNDKESDAGTVLDSSRQDEEDLPVSSYNIDISEYEEYIYTEDEKYLMLVNPENSCGKYVPDDLVYSSDATEYDFSGYNIDRVVLKALTAMCLEAESDGIFGIDITSAYRSYAYQDALFGHYCDQEMSKNPSLTRKEAEEIVSTYSCRAGTSEHQTGLCVDLRVRGDNDSLLEESFADTGAGAWLAENCERFGFILRFPAEKTDKTGIIYEPWHFRFVGYKAANEMKSSGLCLEEYVEKLGI